eukprot:m.998639 g.998639  ORF g.998639 m.998639 type:complete len:58 (+) comp24025_c0_seq15:1307-1480(+)
MSQCALAEHQQIYDDEMLVMLVVQTVHERECTGMCRRNLFCTATCASFEVRTEQCAF